MPSKEVLWVFAIAKYFVLVPFIGSKSLFPELELNFTEEKWRRRRRRREWWIERKMGEEKRRNPTGTKYDETEGEGQHI